ncbi:DUF1955 domain-containing protein [Helicobacter saguini]|uniref:DUF1955 domain-containing protein n=1 Tax=Helicobacter saguini TaxID=1548018 RepID=A0A347VRC2_9HELI|nr:DUF1955 domain-containing protein [Helicobacter saguini]MWV62954.1 DUF1955 domain-containing protein [Helicobacter saguini]MWV66375.1 DUF1955 domain-containing protein [Helicobacter saguini]MWV68728.1 DUF1955 domain-containing protein [Helicobacter saguini]MWV71720.1 DUF1955 domain-containing protein [Helicobacter saguini]TLD92165.1 DUF1955 domain-containing protein [Helicobacter saguini]
MFRIFFSVFLCVNIMFCVPQNIQDEYDDICWNCYDPSIPIQNFLNRNREILKNLCFKNDVNACMMIANLYAKSGNDFDAQDYWQKACKLGNKDACPMVDSK